MLRPFNRSIHLWLLVFAVAGFTYFGLQAVLFNLYLLRLGFEPQFIGLLIGSGQVVFALAALPSGELGRRVGVRGALIVGLVLIGVAYVLLLSVEALPHSWWVAWLLLWWALSWVGAALANVNSVPYAVSLAGDAAPRAFAVQSAVLGVTAFAGSLAGAALLGLVADWTGASAADPAPYRTVMWLTPLAFILCAGAMLAAKPAPRVLPDRAVSDSGRAPVGLFVLLGVIVFLFTTGEGTARAFFNVYLDIRLAATPAAIGVTMGLAQLVPVAAALAVLGLVTRFGTAGTLVRASLVSAAGLIALGAIPLLPVAGAGYMAVMAMTAVHGATRNVFSQHMVEVPWRTTTAAILTVGMGLGWASSAAVGGLLLAVVDFGGLFFLTSGLAAGAALVTWRYQRATQVHVAGAARPGLIEDQPHGV